MFTNRITSDDLPNSLPIFPLQDALLLPNGLLPLNIFEERYIRMVDDALASHRFIGMVQPDLNARKNGQKDAIVNIGCAGRITQFSEFDDNRYMIMLSGITRFEIKEELSTLSPYRQVKPNWNTYADDLVEDCDTIQIDRDYFLPLLKQYLRANDMNCDWAIIESTSCETLLTTLPMICPFEPQEKQALLEAKTLDNRYQILSSLIEIGLKSSQDKTATTH